MLGVKPFTRDRAPAQLMVALRTYRRKRKIGEARSILLASTVPSLPSVTLEFRTMSTSSPTKLAITTTKSLSTSGRIWARAVQSSRLMATSTAICTGGITAEAITFGSGATGRWIVSLPHPASISYLPAGMVSFANFALLDSVPSRRKEARLRQRIILESVGA